MHPSLEDEIAPVDCDVTNFVTHTSIIGMNHARAGEDVSGYTALPLTLI